MDIDLNHRRKRSPTQGPFEAKWSAAEADNDIRYEPKTEENDDLADIRPGESSAPEFTNKRNLPYSGHSNREGGVVPCRDQRGKRQRYGKAHPSCSKKHEQDVKVRDCNESIGYWKPICSKQAEADAVHDKWQVRK